MFMTWVKSLILYLILAGLAINMAPSNQYKQYIRYFTGLVVIVLLARPISYVFRLGSGNLDELVGWMEEAGFPDTSMQGATQSVMQESAMDTIYDYYDMGLRESMRQDLRQFGVKDIDIVTNQAGNVMSATVYLPNIVTEMEQQDATGSLEIEEKIKNYIWDVYNVNLTRIYVVRR